MAAGATPLDRLRSKKKPFTQRVSICCDVELAERFDRITAERDELRGTVDRFGFLERPVPDDVARKLEDLEAEHEALEAQVIESNETFVFRGLRRDVLDGLLDAHRPAKAQIDENAKKGLPAPEWNADSFPAALCAATCISHADLSVDDWKTLWHEADEFNSAELQSLFAGAYNANVNMRVVDMGKGSAGTRS